MLRTIYPATARAIALLIASLLSIVSCSAGDPPNPDAARGAITTTGSANAAEDADDEDAAGLTDAQDDALDAVEERFDSSGVKDVRGTANGGVSIRLEDDRTVADAAPVCAAVRAAGFRDVHVEIDDVVSPCP